MIAIFLHLSAKCNFQRRYWRNKIFSRNHFNRQSSSSATPPTSSYRTHRVYTELTNRSPWHTDPSIHLPRLSGTPVDGGCATKCRVNDTNQPPSRCRSMAKSSFVGSPSDPPTTAGEGRMLLGNVLALKRMQMMDDGATVKWWQQ